MGLRVAVGLRVKEVVVYGDLALIISQIQNRWKMEKNWPLPFLKKNPAFCPISQTN